MTQRISLHQLDQDVVASVTAGERIDVDNTDPLNPEVTAHRQFVLLEVGEDETDVPTDTPINTPVFRKV
jgi:hypothetical protein